MLSALFLQNTGRELKPEHLGYLAKMAFRKLITVFPILLAFSHVHRGGGTYLVKDCVFLWYVHVLKRSNF